MCQAAGANDNRNEGEKTITASSRKKTVQLEKEKAAHAEKSVDGFVWSTLHAVCHSHRPNPIWTDISWTCFSLGRKDLGGVVL